MEHNLEEGASTERFGWEGESKEKRKEKVGRKPKRDAERLNT